MPAELTRLIRVLARAGYSIEIRAAFTASFVCVIRNALEQEVGDLEYRSSTDEPNPWAQGVSYAGYVFDIQRVRDPALRIVQYVTNKEKPCP